MQTIIDWLYDFTGWLLEVLLYVPTKVWELILGAVATVLEAIPVPSWMATDPFAGIDPGIAWMLNEFQIAFGLVVVLGALGIRFLIRRIPLIG